MYHHQIGNARHTAKPMPYPHHQCALVHLLVPHVWTPPTWYHNRDVPVVIPYARVPCYTLAVPSHWVVYLLRVHEDTLRPSYTGWPGIRGHTRGELKTPYRRAGIWGMFFDVQPVGKKCPMCFLWGFGALISPPLMMELYTLLINMMIHINCGGTGKNLSDFIHFSRIYPIFPNVSTAHVNPMGKF